MVVCSLLKGRGSDSSVWEGNFVALVMCGVKFGRCGWASLILLSLWWSKVWFFICVLKCGKIIWMKEIEVRNVSMNSGKNV